MKSSQSNNVKGIQVIARAADILRAVENEPEGLSLSGIAARVSLARSTAQRIVKALVDEQLLMPASSKGRVRLGAALVRLGRAANVDVAQIARPFMQKLSVDTGETVDLSILQRNSAVFVEQVASSHRLAAISRVGTAFPLHSTANGKALLACLPEKKQAELLARTLSNDTAATITDRTQLAQQLAEIRARGVAFDLQEHTDGICAVGTFFLDSFGHAYALSIPVPTPRFEAKRSTLQAMLLNTRNAICRQIDGSRVPHA